MEVKFHQIISWWK